MKKTSYYSWLREALWAIATLFVSAMLLFPIWRSINYQYSAEHFGLIFLALTYFRYIFFFRQIPFVKPRFIRWIWGFLNIVLFIALIFRLQYYTDLFESFSLYRFTVEPHDLSIQEETTLLYSMRGQILFFTTLLFLSIVGFQFRILQSMFYGNKPTSTETIYKKDSL